MAEKSEHLGKLIERISAEIGHASAKELESASRTYATRLNVPEREVEGWVCDYLSRALIDYRRRNGT